METDGERSGCVTYGIIKNKIPVFDVLLSWSVSAAAVNLYLVIENITKGNKIIIQGLTVSETVNMNDLEIRKKLSLQVLLLYKKDKK